MEERCYVAGLQSTLGRRGGGGGGFFFQAEDGIRDRLVTGVQTCALPIYFIPAGFFMALVLAFVFVGDGLRDAADPYAEHGQ